MVQARQRTNVIKIGKLMSEINESLAFYGDVPRLASSLLHARLLPSDFSPLTPFRPGAFPSLGHVHPRVQPTLAEKHNERRAHNHVERQVQKMYRGTSSEMYREAS